MKYASPLLLILINFCSQSEWPRQLQKSISGWCRLLQT